MKPFFIETCSGSLFGVFWPSQGNDLNQAILHIPAFAEEMNKSRRMVALQARALAEQGYAMSVIDLFGTGDSDGDFGEASWDIWLQNIADVIAWLKQQGAHTITLWGLRLGALLAMDFSHHNPGLVDRLLLWQPVLNGDVFVTQFLRLRVAAAMMNAALPQEKTSELKSRLLNGQTLEVAGYALHPDLIRPLVALKAVTLSLQNIKEVVIFELAASNESEPSLLNQQFLNRLQAVDIKASLTVVEGDTFWGSQEIVTTLNLIQFTSEKVKQWL
jgi:exosortase A-associated hydrolase 2